MESENLNKVQLNSFQQDIYNGLKQIGDEIATLYIEGIRIFYSDFSIKPYLLAHIAREIEGGIRDVLCSGYKQEATKCSRDDQIQKKFTHIDEICAILEVEHKTEFANFWHEIAKKFHKYAHRSGPWGKPKGKEDFNHLWKNFEKILHFLVGDYIKIIKILDKFLKSPNPTEEMLKTLDNLLTEKTRKSYFFRKLEHINWFIPLKERGYFNAENTFSSKLNEYNTSNIIPFWDILPYLEVVSEKISETNEESYVNDLLEIIKDTTNYLMKNYPNLKHHYTWWYFIKILSNLPNKGIPVCIIDLIPYWLDTQLDDILIGSEILNNLLPKFMESENEEDIEKVEKIFEYVTKIKWKPRYTDEQKKEIKESYKRLLSKEQEKETFLINFDREEENTIINIYIIKDFFIDKGYAIKLGEKCSKNLILNLANRLNMIIDKTRNFIVNGKKYDFSYVEIKSLFNEGENYNIFQVIVNIIKNILLSKAKIDIELTKDIIEELLNYEYPIFKRLVLFIIGSYWNYYKNFFWRLVENNEMAIELFNDIHYETEVYKLLENNIRYFTCEEKQKIKEIIEKKISDDLQQDRNTIIKYYIKQKWYSALKSDNDFNQLYEKYKELTKKDININFEEPEVRWGWGKSPLRRDEIIEMDKISLAEFLKDFRTSDPWEGPSIEALAEELRGAVSINPEKFINNLNPFLRTSYLYVYNILWGILEGWKANKKIIWEPIIDFIFEYIKPAEFWNDSYKLLDEELKSDHNLVISVICEIIKEAIRDDNSNFSEKYLEKIKDILFIITDKSQEEKENITNENSSVSDYLFLALNSTFGKLSEDLFLFWLTLKRKGSDIDLTESIKNKYDKFLENKIIESYVWFGYFLINFLNLDNEWTKNKINTILNEENQIWEAFMSGYLWRQDVSDELYSLMIEHYKRAINHDFQRKDIQERFIHHVCISYLSESEVIENNQSVFRILLDHWNYESIKEIIRYFWLQSKEFLGDNFQNSGIFQKRIINFWKWVIENKFQSKMKKDFNDTDRIILSNLLKLTSYLDEINEENSKWLELSAPFAHIDFNSPFFIEYLNRLKENGESYKYLGQIFLKILDGSTPTYRKDDIIEIVEFLYQRLKDHEIPNKICNIYAKRGVMFLRALYEKYNSSENISNDENR